MLRATVLTTALAAAAAATSDPHPTLPTMWTATVKEDEVGVVYESENFVPPHHRNSSNPDAKWTNYTDGSCNRLIYATEDLNGMKYLLGCDALDCCTEEDEDGTVEYQIPNVHPAAIAPVHHKGQETFSRFDGVSVTADVYEWKFTVETYAAYVTNGTGEHAVLQRWDVTLGDDYTNEYANYTEVSAEDAAAFKATFYEPEVCKQAMKCQMAFEKGLISEKSLKFLRSGKTRRQQQKSMVSGGLLK